MDLDEWLGLGFVSACVFVGVGLLTFLICAIGNRIEFPMNVAQIEAVRAAAAVIDPLQSEDVIGQVVEANRLIASSQRANQIPVIWLAIPNGWDKVQPIEVPTR